jgi:Arc/MetJ-type ribon-helix-helix transcriptional regulator
MTVDLTPDQERAIAEVVNGGRFSSTAEFIRIAIEEALFRENRSAWWDRMHRYGQERAQGLGITEEDVDRVIHEFREGQ